MFISPAASQVAMFNPNQQINQLTRRAQGSPTRKNMLGVLVTRMLNSQVEPEPGTLNLEHQNNNR
jgi:hypothetical protein